MPIRNCAFKRIDSFRPPQPILPVKIINPENNKSIRQWGIIDTGADDCAIPAWVAEKLGHNLKKGSSKHIDTASGSSIAYSHTTTILILHPDTYIQIYELDNIPVDFVPDLLYPLWGVNNFLSRFILEVNYPHQLFSLKIPSR